MNILPQYSLTTEYWYVVYKAAEKASLIMGQPVVVGFGDYKKMMEAKRIKEQTIKNG